MAARAATRSTGRVRRREARFVACAALAVVALLPGRVFADATDATMPTSQPIAHYCGIYCVSAALKGLGIPVDLERLLERKYVGSWAGSSAGELVRAVEDDGGHGLALTRLSQHSLRAAQGPIILHVSKDKPRTTYYHWVLFLGFVDDQNARVFDPPGKVHVVPLAELLAHWGGTGVLVSDRPIEQSPLVWASSAALVIYGAIGLACALLLSLAVERRTAPAALGRASLGQAAAVLVVSALAAGGYHAASSDGFFRNGRVLASVREAYVPTPLAVVSRVELAADLERADVLIIDARTPRAYAMGHILGAMNLPIGAGPSERRECLANVPTDRRIVVYCQSDKCHFDEEISSGLVADGYENIALYQGGWKEWDEAATAAAATNDE
jgi:rhodanese-related sulfurtransferase